MAGQRGFVKLVEGVVKNCKATEGVVKNCKATEGVVKICKATEGVVKNCKVAEGVVKSLACTAASSLSAPASCASAEPICARTPSSSRSKVRRRCSRCAWREDVHVQPQEKKSACTVGGSSRHKRTSWRRQERGRETADTPPPPSPSLPY